MVNGSTSPSIRLGGFIAIKLVMIELCLKDPNFCCFSTKLHFCDKLTKVFSPIFFNEKFRVEQRNERFHFRNTGWFCIESSENNCYSVRHLPRLHLRLLRICLGFFFFFWRGGGGGAGNKRKLVCHSEKDIRFQTNMAARVVHALIFQTFIFHTRNENTSFKTSKRKEKVLTNVFLTWEWRLES